MNFKEILHKFRTESFTEKEKGTKFERLMRSWLLTDPRYNELEKVWPWEEFPGRKDFGGTDTGIDLVAKTEMGDYWAIQCKCYAEDATIDKPAVDSFLATSSRTFTNEVTFQTTRFSNRVWISTTSHWGSNAEEAIRNQEPPVTRVGMADLNSSPVDWQKLLDGLAGNSALIEGKNRASINSMPYPRHTCIILQRETTVVSSSWPAVQEKPILRCLSPNSC